MKTFSELSNKDILVSPSILSADFASLGEDIKRVEEAGADLIHVDVMDGHFVPNISIGVPVVKSARPVTKLPFDVHLMISDPLTYAEAFVNAGADLIVFHAECNSDIQATIDKVKELGVAVGISVKPKTPASVLAPFIDQIDLVLVMTVEPGFGGQSFMEDQLPKIREIREMIDATGKNIHLEVDGGVAAGTAGLVKEAGANMLVAGTAVFKAPEGMAAAIANLKA